jgi:hypothetical protein
MRADEALSNLEISGVASVNIEVDKDAELSIVIDKANGDFKIKRGSPINLLIPLENRFNGTIQLKEGSYE